MTTFAMVFGMLPVAFGLGEGSETRSPMGIAVIGGLLTSLFLTLVVVPAAYDLFDDWQGFFRGAGREEGRRRRNNRSCLPSQGSGSQTVNQGGGNHEDVSDYLLRGGG